MTLKKCGCVAPSCGCCEGTRKITPLPTANRPGLDVLSYRIGTHGPFLETMKARLGNMIVEAEASDGQTIETFYPLQGLTTRDTADPSIALLDGWATVGDVLTFYQERIANEGYLRTATERRSVLELARLVGYTLRPGVAATVFLAYTLDDTQVDPVEIPAGARSQSIPGPGESPQSFETSDNLIAQREWNNLQVRLQQPQDITLDNALFVEKFYVAGINTNLKTGDLLLLVFDNTGKPSVVRTVASIESQFEQNRTEIRLQPLSPEFAVAMPILLEYMATVRAMTLQTGHLTIIDQHLTMLEDSLNMVRLGTGPTPAMWVQAMSKEGFSTGSLPPALVQALENFKRNLTVALGKLSEKSTTVQVTDPSKFVPSLLKPRIQQAASSLQLGRSLKATFQSGTDAPAQLLVNVVPDLKDNFYRAWSTASLSSKTRDLKAVYVMRLQASLFGASVPDQPTFFLEDKPPNAAVFEHVKGQLKPQANWTPWPLSGEANDTLFLDQAHEEILPSSYVMIQKSFAALATREVHQVVDAQTVQRSAYGQTAKTTRIKIADSWWKTDDEASISQTLRQTLVYGQSEELKLVDAPITDTVQVTKEDLSTGIILDGLYSELTSGRWLIFSGERADIPNVSGVKGIELLMVSGLRQVDPIVAGDRIHTALLLATPTAYSYKRDTLTIYGNVVKATHGETSNETLGSGDGSQALQRFVLKQPPLTFVPAPTAAGVESTLHVYVNNVEWHEAETLAYLEPRDRKFTTKTDDDDKTTVIFGNGQEGARVPTGVLNVNAVYRKGIGKGGNVKAGQVSLLQTRPLGVKEVINPLRASGGADKEDRDQARENAPLAVMALDRLVSLTDYADFTRTFAGIAKASGKRLSNQSQQLVHLTIAGLDDIPIDPEGDLQRNLLAALRNLGDISVAVKIDPRELIILVLAANIRLQTDYLWDPVAAAVREALVSKFGFRKRALGQAALLCEIIGCIQSVEGVAYIDVDAFGGVPEKIPDSGGVLQTLPGLADAVQKIVTGSPTGPVQAVNAGLAIFAGKNLRPAQLAIFTPDVPDTIVLNQIK